MKKLLIAATLAATSITGVAHAATPSPQTRLESAVPSVDASGLSNAEAVAVLDRIQGITGHSNKKAAAEAMIRTYN